MWYKLNRDQIDHFKASWPCHGLPCDFDEFSVEFQHPHGLIDYMALDSKGLPIELRDYDGAALNALIEDAAQYGEAMP